MDTTTKINFKVTAAQKKIIDSRAEENGFDDISAYLKVVAIKTEPFTLTSAGAPEEEASIELEFTVTETQKNKIEKNMKESGCDDMTTYLQYVAQHGVIAAVIEVRSTGNLDAMLDRIKNSRQKSNPKKLF
ncbi:MAG: hypothetical protein ABFQ64_01710 [Campylobacterota bacterium]